MFAAICLLAGGALTAAHAMQPATSTGARPQAAPSVPLPPAPSGAGWTNLGAEIDHAVQNVNRAKLRFNVEPFRALAWVRALNSTDPTGQIWSNATAELYVINPGTAITGFGEFAPVNVKMLAFGAIPVSATVYISQLRDSSGNPVPLEVTVRYTATTVKNAPPLPCSPPAWRFQACHYTDPAHLAGQVNVRVANVKIDGVPVDVGPDCTTVSPASMALSAQGGYYSEPVPYYVPPGLYLPFYNGGTFQGPVDVPAFAGCRNGADDLSNVITAMVSGPGNILATHQDGSLLPWPPPPPKKK